MPDLSIEVEGLDEFRKALKEAEGKWGPELGRAHKEVGELVVTESRSAATAQGSLRAKAAESLRASARQTGVSVTLGGPRAQYAVGAEFGGGSHGAGNPTSRGGYTTQFGPFKGHDGYFVFPTIRARMSAIESKFLEVIDRVAKQAFPN